MATALPLLRTWLPRQRWYSAAGEPPALRILGEIPAGADDAGAEVRIYAVADDAAPREIVYQVPVVLRSAPAPTGTSVIGSLPDGRVVTDGPTDPAYTTLLARAIGLPAGDAEVLRGEQSNTSVIYRPEGEPPVICKVYRRLEAGSNPDIELQSALAAAGSPHVPAALGTWESAWTVPDGTASGPLAFAQEFLPGVEDAWRVALRSAAAGADFRRDAEELGRATAEVHLDLARLFPVSEPGPAARSTLESAWRRRLTIALDEVPALAAHRERITRRYDAAASARWPALQRIHGDYHLGQVLQVAGRGWVLLDFEGEPMRPMEERRAPDLALRDIAGMLRSFDYVSGSLVLGAPADVQGNPTAWASSARAAFLAGYAGVTGDEPAGALLDALELDKAVYEAIYEARYRPDWLGIPLAAIERLAGA